MSFTKAVLATIALSFGLFAVASAQGKMPRKSPHDTLHARHITVTYGAPYKKGREIFGKLEPYGKVYRVGADEATTITFDRDGTFGGKPIKAGTYTLFAIPNPDSWTVILNGQLGQWGAFSYDKYKDKDVLHVDVPVHHLSTPVEQMKYTVSGGDLNIEWDVVKVSIPVKF